MNDIDIPLCVDLDGTLIKNDSVAAAFMFLLKQRPLFASYLLFYLFKDIVQFKVQICKNLDPKNLKFIYSTRFLSYLQQEYYKGRKIILITATHQKIANYIAENLGIFSEVIASDNKINMKGKNKTELLNKKFGKKNYDYAGNHRIDKHIWKDARYAILVNANSRLQSYSQKNYSVIHVFND